MDDAALIAHLKLQVEKLRREKHGPPAEFGACLLLQLELELDEFGVTATEDELAKAMDYMLTRWVAPVSARPRCGMSLRS